MTVFLPAAALAGQKKAPALQKLPIIPYYQGITAEQLPAGLKTAHAEWRAGHTEKCAREAERFAEGNKSGADKGYIIAGLCKLEKNDVEGARAEFDRAVAARGASPEAAYYKGIALHMAGDQEHAISALEEAIWFGKPKIIPLFDLHLALARILKEQLEAEIDTGNRPVVAKQKEKEKSSDKFRSPVSKEAVSQGNRIKSLGDRAVKEYSTAISLNSTDMQARAELAAVYLDQHNRAAALQLLRASLPLGKPPATEIVQLELIEALLTRSDRGIPPSDVKEARDSALALLGNSTGKERYKQHAFALYVRALIDSGDIEGARRNLQEALHATSSQELARLSERLRIESTAAAYKAAAKSGEDAGDDSAAAESGKQEGGRESGQGSDSSAAEQ